MKKLSLIVALLVSGAYAGSEFDKNFAKNLKENLGLENFKILSVDKFKSMQDLNLVVFENNENNQTNAVFTSKDGKSMMSIPKFITFADALDNEKLTKKIDEISTMQKQKQDKIVYEMIKTIPEDRFVKIDSFDPNNKAMMYMVSDPECPDCKYEIDRLVKWIRNANLRIIFAPVHGKSAFTKSAVLLNESKKIDPKSQDELIKLFQKYYDPQTKVSDDMASDKERDLVMEDAKKLFGTGAIKGVPFSFVVEK